MTAPGILSGLRVVEVPIVFVEAELGEIDADKQLLETLRSQMRLTLERAQDKCLECHDIDNSPDFHKTGAFETYWDQVKHYGKD